MVSANGRIPAGDFTVKLASEFNDGKNRFSCTSTLKKCPDKTAIAKYSITRELIQQLTDSATPSTFININNCQQVQLLPKSSPNMNGISPQGKYNFIPNTDRRNAPSPSFTYSNGQSPSSKRHSEHGSGSKTSRHRYNQQGDDIDDMISIKQRLQLSRQFADRKIMQSKQRRNNQPQPQSQTRQLPSSLTSSRVRYNNNQQNRQHLQQQLIQQGRDGVRGNTSRSRSKSGLQQTPYSPALGPRQHQRFGNYPGNNNESSFNRGSPVSSNKCYSMNLKNTPVSSRPQQSPQNKNRYVLQNINKNQDLHLQQIKILKLQKENAQLIRQVNLLKKDFAGVDNQKICFLEDKNASLREQIDEILVEMQKLRESTKSFERIEKQHILSIRSLKEELQHRNIKINQYQLDRAALQQEKGNLEKREREMDDKYSKLRAELAQIESSFQQQQKKHDQKENSYKEQLKRLSEKYIASETERQKLSLSLSNVQQQMFINEKKGEISAKQNERRASQQRSFLKRKNEELQKQNVQLTQKLNQLEQQVSFLSKEKVQIDKKLKETQDNLLISQDDNSQLAERLQQKDKQIVKLQDEIQQLTQSLSGQMKTVSKLSSKLEKDNLKVGNQVSKLKQEIQNIKNKKQEVEVQLDKCKADKKSIEKEIPRLKQQKEYLKKQQSELRKQMQTMSACNLTQSQKLNNLQAKLQTTKENFQQQLNYMHQQYQLMVRQKQYLQEELRDQSNTQHSKDLMIDNLQEKIKLQNEQILELNKKLLILQEQQKRKEEEKKSLEMTNQSQLIKIEQKDSKIAEYKQLILKQSEAIQNLEKKIRQVEHQNNMNVQKLLVFQQSTQSDKNNIKNVIEKHQKKDQEKRSVINRLQKQNSNLNNQILSLKSEINHAKTSLKLNKEQTQQLKQQNDTLKESQLALKEKIQSLSQSSLQTQMKNQNLRAQLESIKKQLNQQHAQSESYKKQSLQAFQDLLEKIQHMFNHESARAHLFSTNSSNLIIKSRHSSQSSLSRQFPDIGMVQLQMSLLQFLKQHHDQMHSNVHSLSDQLRQFQQELAKQRQLNEKYEVQIEEELFIQKQKSNSLIDQKQTQIHQYRAKFFQIEALNADLQKELQTHRNTISLLQDNIECMQEQVKSLQTQNMALKRQTQTLEEQVQLQKQNQIKLKTQYQNQIKQIENKRQLSLSSFKNDHSGLEKDSVQTKKILLERQSQISQLQAYQEQISAQNSNLKSKMLELQQRTRKAQSSEKMIQQGIQHKSNAISLLEQSVQKLQALNKSEADKSYKLSSQVKQLKREKQQLSFKNEKLQEKLKLASEENGQFAKQLKELKIKLSQNQLNKLRNTQDRREELSNAISQIDLKQFQNDKLIERIQELQENCQKLKSSIKEKSSLIQGIQIKLGSTVTQNMQLQSDIESLKQDISRMEHTIVSLKQQKQELQEFEIKYQEQAQQVRNYQNQNLSIKADLASREKFHQEMSAGLRASLVETKKQLAHLHTKEEEHRKRVREIEGILDMKNYQIAEQNERITRMADIQKRQLNLYIEELQKEIQNKTSEFEFQVQQLRQQISDMASQILQLNTKLQQSTEVVQKQEKELSDNQNQISSLKDQLKNVTSQWQRQKATYHPTDENIKNIQSEIKRFEQFSREIDGKSKQLIEVAKRKSEGNAVDNVGITNILKEVALINMKTKIKVLSRCHNDKQKQQVIGDYKILQETLEKAMKSHGIMRPAIGNAALRN